MLHEVIPYGALARSGRGLASAARFADSTLLPLMLAVGCAAALPLCVARATGGVAAFCIANGILLVAVLRARPHQAPTYLCAGLLANVIAQFAVGDAGLGGIGLALCNTIEVAVAALFVRRRLDYERSVTGGNLVEITLLAGAVAPAIGATIAVLFVLHPTPQQLGYAWTTWYVRDAFGMVLVVPFGLSLERPMVVAIFRRERLARTLAVLGSLVCVDCVVFGQESYPVLFIIFPVFAVASFRLGVAGAALAVLLTALVALPLTLSGHGVLMLAHAASPLARVDFLQLFLAISTWMALPIAAVLRDRDALLVRLQDRWKALTASHGDLEERNARTGELIALQEAITSALPSSQAVIDVVLRFVQAQTRATGAVMGRVAGDEIVYESATGALAGSVGMRVKVAASLGGLSVVSNEVLSCSDAETDARVDAAACRRLNVRSMIVVPLAIEGSVSGVLTVASARAHAFAEHDVLNLQLAARHLTSAMRAATSYERMELAEAEAQATIENHTDAIVVFAADGTVLRHNAAAERVLGLTTQQVRSWASDTNVLAVDIDERELSYEERPVHRALRTGTAQRDVVVGVGTGLDRRWISMSVAVVASSSGAQAGRFILSARDVTDLQRSELEQRQYARQLSSLHLIASQVTGTGNEQTEAALRLCREELGLDWGYLGVIDSAASELIIEISVGTEAEDAPQALGARIPLERTLIGRVLGKPDVLAVSDLATLLANDPSVVVNGRWGAYIAVPIRVAGAVYGAIGFTGRLARPSGFLASERDFVRITADLIGSSIERRWQQERLDALAHRDALTNLPNRLVFDDRLDQTLLFSKRYEERFAVLYIDLDGFKSINDTYGHGTGDDVLRTVARRLENLVRESDTVARIGGDEFLVLAPKIRSVSDASELAWRIVREMRLPMSIDGIDHELSASVGASVFPEDGDDAGTIVRSADSALYRAKVAGKNSVAFACEVVLRSAS